MPKDNNMMVAVIVIVLLVFFANQEEEPIIINGDNGNNGRDTIDLCKLVESESAFTAQRLYLAGTALPGEGVRVIRMNGEIRKDLGQKSLNSGTLSTDPGVTYQLYFGENSSLYYTKPKPYTAPCKDATDDVMEQLCRYGNLTIKVLNEYGQVQSNSTQNRQAVGSDQEKTVELELTLNQSDTCYGNPDAPTGNAMCFKFNTTVIQSVKIDGASTTSTPTAISNSYNAAGFDIDCYEFEKMSDNQELTLMATITATSTDPGTSLSHNGIYIYTDDIAFDLDADTLEPIWGFEDEDDNALGTSVAGTAIYLS